DISKAFDRTWHDGLLFKLANIGITGNAWRWCRAFLKDRRIRTAHDGQFSDWFNIDAGVPQGSVLSPFLFLVYINDVFDWSDAIKQRVELSLFADDIAVVPRVAGKEGDDKMVAALISLENWCKAWQMEFNVKKSKLLCFSKSRRKPEVRTQSLRDGIIERVKTFDYLGLRWQENAQWHHHLDKVVASSRRASYMICSLLNRHCPRLPAIRTLCHALIRSRAAYGMPVWSPPTQAGWRKLDTLITGPMRICLRLPRSTFMDSLLIETKTTRTQHLHEMLTVSTAVRARGLPEQHPTRCIVEEQQDQKITVRRRPPLLPHANEIADRLAIDLKAVPNRKALQRQFVLYHQNEWRNSGKGKLLVSLTPASQDDAKRLRLPLYTQHDCSRGASVRAKLRFDRSNLKDTLARQTIIPESKA